MARQIAFMLLDRLTLPDLSATVEIIQRRHPGIAASLPGSAQKPDGNTISPMLLCGGEMVVVMSPMAPLPRDEDLLTRAAAVWPDVRAVFDQHRAHLIVSVLGTEDRQLPIARAITAVTGALASSVPGCLGIVWNGRVALPPAPWIQMSQGAYAPYPGFPAPLWVSMHPFGDQRTGGIGVVTQGLAGFAGRELELIGPATGLESLLEKTDGLIRYLIEKGPVLKDGSTFGVSETERIAVRLCMSDRFPGLAVIAGSLGPAE